MKLTNLLWVIIFMMPAGCNQNTGENLRPSRGASHESVTANINLGVEYMRQGSYETALEKLDRARKIDPGYYGTYTIYGLLYQRMGEYPEAEKNFRKALSLSNNDPATLNNFGQFLCQTERPAEADEIFLRAIANPLNASPEVALTNAAICAQIHNNTVKAESYFRRALDINPRIHEALIRMAQISFDNNNYMSARAYLQRFQELAGHTAKSLWLGVRIEEQLGNKNAVSSYSLLLKNNFPDSSEAGLLEQTGKR
jgi:type IV pilus assembly protein PilF